MEKNIEEGKSLQETIDGDIRHCENSIKVADDIIADANVTRQKALSAKKLDRNVVQNAQSKIEIGQTGKERGQLKKLGTQMGYPIVVPIWALRITDNAVKVINN